MPVENRVDYPVRHEAVTTTVDIDAPPAAVWRDTVAIPRIRPDELHWTFTQNVVGVPKPQDARLEGAGPGAVRHATWGRGVRFEEVVSQWTPERAMAWTFRFDAANLARTIDPHLRFDSGYLTLTGGDYRLIPLSPGHTRLRLTTHYQARVPAEAYWAFWGRVFLGDVQGNVLGVVKARAEADARPSAGHDRQPALPGATAEFVRSRTS